MRDGFAIRAWSAIAPGLQTYAQWLAWADQPFVPTGALEMDFSHISAMARRRLGHIAKLAVFAADSALAALPADASMPVVWASRYGDAEKSLALLQSQAQQELLSPTAFGLSVHNGVAGQHSILRGMKGNAVCVASSHSAPEAGMVEALGLLHDGAPEVLLVCYDSALPGAYASFHSEPMVDFAWAVRLTTGVAGQPHWHLRAVPPASGNQSQNTYSGLPRGLDVLHFLLQPRRLQLVNTHATGQWLWERVHA